MSRTVAIIGTGTIWADVYPERYPDAELWVCNGALRHHLDADRLYYMDDEHHFPKPWHDAVEAFREQGGQVFNKDNYPLAATNGLAGRPYYTSTVAYMLAHACLEGVGRIIIHGIYCLEGHPEYVTQKPCLDFWMGVARGKGIEVVTTAGSLVGQPMACQSARYGYEVDNQDDILKAHLDTINGRRKMEWLTQVIPNGDAQSAMEEITRRTVAWR